MTLWSASAALTLVLYLGNLSPAPAAECLTCHPAEARAHAGTAHASALMPVRQSAFASHLPDHALGEAVNGFLFTYQLAPVGLVATAARGSERAEGLIQWVVGSGRRGQTPLVTSHDRTFEHRVSFYAATGKYGITTGQPNGASANAIAALGFPEDDHDLKACFNCHATGTPADPATFSPGIQCARCHAGAEQHALGHGLPVNPGKLDSAAQVQLCAACHRSTPQPGNDLAFVNVRFQPLQLMKSRCYLEGRIACTTCHVAHADARRNDPAFYNAKCLACHGAQPQRIAQHTAKQQSSDCISCHMPRSRPHPALEFTDHFIRVVASAPPATAPRASIMLSR